MADLEEIQVELGEYMPGDFIGPLLIVAGLVVALALLVLLLVSGAHFTEQRSSVLTTPGTCAPFCGVNPTGTPAAPRPS